MRLWLEHGNHQQVPCFLLDGFHWDEPLALARKVWAVGKGMLQGPAAVLVQVCEKYVKAKNEERRAGDEETMHDNDIMRLGWPIHTRINPSSKTWVIGALFPDLKAALQ